MGAGQSKLEKTQKDGQLKKPKPKVATKYSLPTDVPKSYQLPTSGNLKQYKRPIRDRLMLWYKKNFSSYAAQSDQRFTEDFSPKWDKLDETDENFRWKPGMKAYSQILNGPYNGKWIEVKITAVHPNGKIDLKILDYQKYRVYASAVDVPITFVRRTKPDTPKGKEKKIPPWTPERPRVAGTVWKVGDTGYSEILSGTNKGAWITVVVKRVHVDEVTKKVTKLDIYIPDYKKYNVYAHALEVPESMVRHEQPPPAFGNEEVKNHAPAGGPDMEDQLSMSSSGGTSPGEEIEKPTKRPKVNINAPSPRNKDMTWVRANPNQTPVFDDDADALKLSQLGAIVRVIMNLECDENSQPTEPMLEELWKELDQDRDGFLCDSELLDMLVAIAEAWKQKTSIEFEDMKRGLSADIKSLGDESDLDEDLTNKYRDHLLSVMEDRIKTIKEESQKHVAEVKAELDLDFDGFVSKKDFLLAAPFVLFASSGTDI